MPTPVTRPRANASCRSYGERIGLDAGSVGGAAGHAAGLLAERNGPLNPNAERIEGLSFRRPLMAQ